MVGLVSNWVTLFTFKYDGAAPGNPGVGSSSHSLASWSPDPTVDVYWSGASDGSGSGINGYSFEWSTSASTLPDTVVDTTGTGTTSGSLSTGSSWYFHIRTRDNVGNWNSGATHYGPFYIDTIAPSNPTVSSSSHSLSTWSADPTVDVSWSGASDGTGSGVGGYSIEWSTSSTTLPDTVSDTTGSSATSPSLADSSSWYFHIRTRDNAGNWAGAAVHYGPFYIDTTAPTAPTSASPNCTAANAAWQNTCSDPNFTWSGASDTGSGLAGFYYYWGSDPAGTSSSFTTSAGYNPAAVVNPSITYLRVQSRDNTGRTSSWVTLYTFMYDGSAPTNPAPSSTSHATGSWSTDNTIDVTWSGASDGAGSGINGYSIEWSLSAGTLPDTVVDTSGGSATSPALNEGSTWYFHIRTRDNAGNWNGSAVHLGPFMIDATAPIPPASANPNCTAANNTWQNTCSDPSFTWSGASDGGSGLAGYNYYWGADFQRHFRQLDNRHIL